MLCIADVRGMGFLASDGGRLMSNWFCHLQAIFGLSTIWPGTRALTTSFILVTLVSMMRPRWNALQISESFIILQRMLS